MASRRQSKVAEAVREVVSMAILRYLRDPRIKNVTVLSAEVTPDLREAKVYVSVMGEEKVKALSMKGLNAARGFLQSKIAERIETRYTPVLTFVLDHPDSPARQVDRILYELELERAKAERKLVETTDTEAGQSDEEQVTEVEHEETASDAV